MAFLPKGFNRTTYETRYTKYFNNLETPIGTSIHFYLLVRVLFIVGLIAYYSAAFFLGDNYQLANTKFSITILFSYILPVCAVVCFFKEKSKKLYNKTKLYISLSAITDFISLTIITIITQIPDFYLLSGLYILVGFYSYFLPNYFFNEAQIKKYQFKEIINCFVLGKIYLIFFSAVIALLCLWFANHHNDLIKTEVDLFVLILTFLVISFSLTHIKFSKERQLLEILIAMEERDKEMRVGRLLQRASFDIGEIRNFENEKDFFKKINSISKVIQRTFNVEYCSIGIFEGTVIKNDIKPSMAYALNEREQIGHAKIKNVKELSNTFIYNILSKRESHFIWNESKNGDFVQMIEDKFDKIKDSTVNSSLSKIYKYEFLRSKQLKHILIIGLYQQVINIPIGYILLLNKLNKIENGILKNLPLLDKKGFNQRDITALNLVGRQIALAYDNFEIHHQTTLLNNDEKFVNNILQEESIEQIFSSILKYLNNAFNSNVASYWVPTEEGLDKTIKMVLRAVEEDNKIAGKVDLKKQKYFSEEDCYIQRIINSPFEEQNKIIYETDLSKTDCDAWYKYFEAIEAKQFVAIPILKSGINQQTHKENWKNLHGVVCIRPRDKEFNFDSITKERLTQLGTSIRIIIEKVIYKRRYKQLEVLKLELSKLTFDDINNFYYQLTKLVQKVVGAEACSLFFVDKKQSNLVLKTTTSPVAYQWTKEGSGTITYEKFNSDDKIGKNIYSLENLGSLTATAFQKNETILVYDALKHQTNPEALNFIEETFLKRDEPHSIILTPLKKNNHHGAIGILRCVNKISNDSLLPVFVEGDKELMVLIVGIVERFMEYTELLQKKGSSINRFVHEALQPVRSMEMTVATLNVAFNDKNTKLVYKKSQTLNNNFVLLKNIISDLEVLLIKEYNIAPSYHFNKVDLFKVIEDCCSTLQEYALFDRRVEIKPLTSQVPLLYVDEARMKQVFFNLIKNAIRYSYTKEKGGQNIVVVYKGKLNKDIKGLKYKEWFVFEVKNFGIGIKESEKIIIFHDYLRGSNAEAHFPSGSGIGLAVCQEIVKAHQGIIKVTKLYKPTIFSIYLPSCLEKDKPS